MRKDSAHVPSGKGAFSNDNAGKGEGRESYVTHRHGQLSYFLNDSARAQLRTLTDEANLFLDTFAFPFTVHCGVDGGAPIAAWHYAIFRSLHGLLAARHVVDVSCIDEVLDGHGASFVVFHPCSGKKGEAPAHIAGKEGACSLRLR